MSRRLINAYMILVGGSVFSALLNATHDIYQMSDSARRTPIKGYIQAIKLVLFFVKSTSVY